MRSLDHEKKNSLSSTFHHFSCRIQRVNTVPQLLLFGFPSISPLFMASIYSLVLLVVLGNRSKKMSSELKD